MAPEILLHMLQRVRVLVHQYGYCVFVDVPLKPIIAWRLNCFRMCGYVLRGMVRIISLWSCGYTRGDRFWGEKPFSV